MKINTLQLTHFGRFKQLDLKLDPGMTVFVGNNGSGKTAILQALAIGLSWFVARLRNEKGNGTHIPIHCIKNGSHTAIIQFEGTAKSTYLNDEELFLFSLAKGKPGLKTQSSSFLGAISKLANHYRSQLTQNHEISLPLVAFYPVERVVLDIPLKIRTKHSFEQLDGYDNSLNQGVDFRRFFEWFREREDSENESGLSDELFQKLSKEFAPNSEALKSLSKLKDSSRDRQLTAVRSAISAFIPEFKNLRVRRKPRLHMAVDKADKTLDINQLSQGEKSLMALVGDIARRLAMMNPALENPLQGEGIVLIDEVDLHLHPQWQRSLVARFRDTFPHCQFVLTTHSPLVISDSKDILCYVLDAGEVQKMDQLYGLDANQVLLKVMDTDIRNAEINQQLNQLLEAIQDGQLEAARAHFDSLCEALPSDHIELAKAGLLMRKLELRREKNR